MATAKDIFEQHEKSAIMGQFVNHEDGDPSVQIAAAETADGDLVLAPEIEARHDIVEIKPQEAKVQPDEPDNEEDDIAPEDRIVAGTGGQTVAELEAARVAAEQEAALYDQRVLQENTARFVAETRMEAEVGTGLNVKPPEKADPHFAEADNQFKQANAHNDAAQANEATRDVAQSQTARLDKALDAAPSGPAPGGPGAA